MKRTVYGVLITIVLVSAVLLIDRSIRMNRPAGEITGDTGKNLPGELELVSFPDRKTTKLSSYSGSVLLLNFWASWCEACMEEMPSIQRLYDALKDKGLQVLSINVDESPDRVVPRIVDRLKLSFPIFVDKSGELSRRFDVVAIPFSVVTGRGLKMLWAESGGRDWNSNAVRSKLMEALEPK